MKNSIDKGLIGEFSFIIASLGLSYGVISAELYPIIVAASLITTFTTPFLLKAAPGVSLAFEQRLPVKIRTTLSNYRA